MRTDPDEHDDNPQAARPIGSSRQDQSVNPSEATHWQDASLSVCTRSFGHHNHEYKIIGSVTKVALCDAVGIPEVYERPRNIAVQNIGADGDYDVRCKNNDLAAGYYSTKPMLPCAARIGVRHHFRSTAASTSKQHHCLASMCNGGLPDGPIPSRNAEALRG